MDIYKLIRVASSPKGTFGAMVKDDEPVCVTCEDPWNNNNRNISCIPFGTYKVNKRISQKYGHHWHLIDVPNRDLILIHGGNTIQDTQGCILVGRSFGHLGGVPSIMQAQDTMTILRETLPDNFLLTILGV